MALSVLVARTYLQLVADLFRAVGGAGSAPTTTVGQTGEAARLVGYIHDAELEIQNLWVDWKWLRKTLTFYTGTQNQTGIFTTQNGAVSAQPNDLAEWDYRTFQILPPGNTFFQDLAVAEWQQVRNQVFDTTDFSQPWRVIVMPDNTFRFDLIPDQSYQCQCEYRAIPYDLKADADVSNIPFRFGNRLIVEWARMKYGMFENAAEQVQAARWQIYGGLDDEGIFHTGLLTQLENDQLANAKNSRLQQGNSIVIGSGDGSDGQCGYGQYW